mgnify:CR=1 FL=1
MRLNIIFVSFFSTLVLLFAIWFIYLAWFVEKPLEKNLLAIDGVQDVSVTRDRQQVQIDVALGIDANLKTVHEAVLEAVKPYANGRELKMNFQDNPSPEMEEAWHRLQFDVEEALSHHQYRALPEITAAMKEELQLDKAVVDMNRQFVYFQFQKGEYRHYLIYPRKQGEEGKGG